jgi:Enoyl-CoA hydratase/isomerase
MWVGGGRNAAAACAGALAAVTAVPETPNSEASVKATAATGRAKMCFLGCVFMVHSLVPIPAIVPAAGQADRSGDTTLTAGQHHNHPVTGGRDPRRVRDGKAPHHRRERDPRVAHRGVRFGLPEVKLGIPSVVEAALLYQYVGLSKAKEIILTGDLYSVSDFTAHGLINRTVEPAQLRAATLELVASVTARTREVIAAQKGLFETWLNHGLQHGIDASVEVFADVFRAPATASAIAEYQRARSRA